MSAPSCNNWRNTSSAVMWRCTPRWKTSRIFRRGPVAFRPLLLRSSICMGWCLECGGRAAGWPLQCPDDIGLHPHMTASLMIRLTLLTLAAVAGLSGCGFPQGVHRDSFKPYVPDVVQGNFVSREQRQYLRPGMTRAQVRDVLGTPLVTSLFHADRWDYAFSIRRQGVPPQQFRLTLYFNQNDVLERIEGDELPSEAEFAQRLSGSNAGGKVPVLEATEEQLRKYPGRTNPQPTAPTQVPLPPTYPPLEPAP